MMRRELGLLTVTHSISNTDANSSRSKAGLRCARQARAHTHTFARTQTGLAVDLPDEDQEGAAREAGADAGLRASTAPLRPE